MQVGRCVPSDRCKYMIIPTHPTVWKGTSIMSQHVGYSNLVPRGSQIPYENPNFRSIPMDVHRPVRGQYPETHLTGPRATPLPYEVYDP